MPSKKILLVLSHGIFGWGDPKAVTVDPAEDYYNGIKPYLKRTYGSRLVGLIAPTVRASDSVEQRGTQLRDAIAKALKSSPSGTVVHIIAHSMGGLDSRWAIAEGGLVSSVASLTTIATPHQGTTLGNLAHALRKPIREAGKGLEGLAMADATIRSVLDLTGLASPDILIFYHRLLANVVENSTEDQIERGLRALTIPGCQAFNAQLARKEREARDRYGVRYLAYGGVLNERPSPVQYLHDLLQGVGMNTTDPKTPISLLRVSHRVLALSGTSEEKATGNDGAVSVWSAHFPWDTSQGNQASAFYAGTVPFDHFRQINWRIPEFRKTENQVNADMPPFYADIMKEILKES